MGHQNRVICQASILGLVLLFLSSCSGTSDTRSAPLEPAPVNPEITFSIFESNFHLQSESHTAPYLALSARTAAEYSCYNYTIPVTVNQSGQFLNISLGEPHLPGGDTGICLDAIGPAKVFLKLPELTGNITLKISWRERAAFYTLEINDNRINITPIKSSATVPLNNALWRYPRMSLAVHCRATWDSLLCSRLYDSLDELSEIEEFSFGDDAVIPYYEADRYYYYESDEDLAVVDSVVSHFRSQHSGGSTCCVGFTTWLTDYNYFFHFSL